MKPKKITQKPPDPKPYDPFSYPRLYPSGWNLDDMDAEPTRDAEAVKMPKKYEPFHELRTFPSGWDLS